MHTKVFSRKYAVHFNLEYILTNELIQQVQSEVRVQVLSGGCEISALLCTNICLVKGAGEQASEGAWACSPEWALAPGRPGSLREAWGCGQAG